MRLKGKIALVMAGQGIGTSIAEAFVDDGAVVCVAAPDLVAGAATTAALRNRGGIAMALVCDVTDRASLDKAVAETLSIFGRIDILVNSAVAQVFDRSTYVQGDDIAMCTPTFPVDEHHPVSW